MDIVSPSHPFLQIVITIWLGVHPVTYTLPKLYALVDHDQCEMRVGWLFAHRKHKRQRMELDCVPTDKREL